MAWGWAGMRWAGLGYRVMQSCMSATRRRAKNAYARSDAHTSCMAWGSARGGAGLQSHACRRRGDARNTRTRVAMRTHHACMARGSDEGLGWAGIHSRTEGVDARGDDARGDASRCARAYTHNNNLGGDGRRGFGTRGAPAHAQTNTAGRTGDIIILYALYNAN